MLMGEEVLSSWFGMHCIKSSSVQSAGGNIREHADAIWAIPFNLWRPPEWVTAKRASNYSVNLDSLHASMQILTALIDWKDCKYLIVSAIPQETRTALWWWSRCQSGFGDDEDDWYQIFALLPKVCCVNIETIYAVCYHIFFSKS